MFNKKECETCIYSGRISGGLYPSCDYMLKTGIPCIQNGVDKRGNKPRKCKLYKKKEDVYANKH